jgi:hypothetical protein
MTPSFTLVLFQFVQLPADNYFIQQLYYNNRLIINVNLLAHKSCAEMVLHFLQSVIRREFH